MRASLRDGEATPADSTFDLDDEEEDIRYGIFRANIDSGEGDLIVQPWMHNRSGMFTAAVMEDWTPMPRVWPTKGSPPSWKRWTRSGARP
jgi:hypothetical protein